MDAPLHTSLHRTAKYFMDSGRSASAEEALALLQTFGLTIVVGPEACHSSIAQIALLTLVNLARRTLLGGVDVIGLGDAPRLCALATASTLAGAVVELGGRVSSEARANWPVAVIGSAEVDAQSTGWRLTWDGWRGGVTPIREAFALAESPNALPLSPALAAAACMAEAFAFHAGDHPMASRRRAGLSLWSPGADWTLPDLTEPNLALLPSSVWLIGLGNLGQAYAWLLACLPYPANGLKVMLQDFDRLAPSNDSTSLLTWEGAVGRMKTRWVAEWLEARGVEARLQERLFDATTARRPDEPGVALCGVDNPAARRALEDAGFDLVVESGLGAGPQSFRNFAMHVFPGSRRAADLWPTTLDAAAPDVSEMPAYADQAAKGLDACGLALLASRTVGVPFVGLLAGLLTISELLRRLNGGPAHDVVAGSALCLDDLESSRTLARPFSQGFCEAAP